MGYTFPNVEVDMTRIVKITTSRYYADLLVEIIADLAQAETRLAMIEEETVLKG